MFGKINWKIVTVISIAALFISFILGGVRGVAFSILLVRGLLFGILFGVLTAGIQLILDRVFPELKEDQPDEAGVTPPTPKLDMTLPQEAADVMASDSVDEDNNVMSVEDSSDLSEDTEAVPEGVSVSPGDAGEESERSEPSDSSGNSGENRGKAPEPSRKKNEQLDVLPDLSNYSETFATPGSEDEQSPLSSPADDFGSDDAVVDHSSSVRDESVQDRLPGGDDPELIAKSISTVLKRDKS